jgi:hypothetical protein
MSGFLAQSPDTLSDNLQATLWDRLYICYILNTEHPLKLEDLIGGLRTLNVVDVLKRIDITSSADLQSLLSATVILPVALGTLTRLTAPVTSSQVETTAAGGSRSAGTAIGLTCPPIPPAALINLGIGDLKVVKQKLLAYVPGEVAHIENVLKGESKDRKFRTLDRTEQSVFTSVETTEDTEKDTQTTERFELKKETENSIKESMAVQAGVTVTASYGPVQVVAHGDFAYSTASENATKSAANFAREVVDRSISKIQKKVKEERATKNLHEVEEINDHALNNVGGAQHVTGVYRWVDKHYTAQIYNYGKRMMLEFIVPEPAAFYIYAQQREAAKQFNLVAPDPPMYRDQTGRQTPLTPTDLHGHFVELVPIPSPASTYFDYISTYAVQGVLPEPAEFVTVSTTLDQSPIENGKSISLAGKDLVIPGGYTLNRIAWSVSLTLVRLLNHLEGDPYFNLLLGDSVYEIVNQEKQPHPGSSGGHPAIHANGTVKPSDLAIDNQSGKLSVAINGYDISSFAVIIDVECRRQPEAYIKWQLDTFDKIMVAYKALKVEYDQKMAAATVQQGVVIQGHNPGINLQIQQAELKKICITMMTGQDYSTFKAMVQVKDSKPIGPPEVNIQEAFQDGRFIRFIEQALEWTQMTYLFYPYFWGKKDYWSQTSNLYDNDPLFTQFLQAGAARVVVPVPLSYVDQVNFYLQTGCLGDAPLLDDPRYVSIADELRNQTDDLEGATPDGPPWPVVIPTTLVWLQPGPELPTRTSPDPLP